MSNTESTRTQPLLLDSKGDLLRARTFSATSIHTPNPENPAKTLCGHQVRLTSEYALTERDEKLGYGKAGELRQVDLTICAGADPQLCGRCERSVAKRQRPTAVEVVPAPEIPAESKTLGEMTPDERQAAVKRAVGKFQAELDASAPAIGKIMDQAELPGIPLALNPQVLAYREIAGLHENQHLTLWNLAGSLEVIVTSNHAGDDTIGLAYAIGFERHTHARVHITAADLASKLYSLVPRWHDDPA